MSDLFMYEYGNSIENRIERLIFIYFLFIFLWKCMLEVIECDLLNEKVKHGNKIIMICMC